jgi:lipopolysaccharide/colanic/teichoic acid biosynthesis glycosyltransferase
MRSRIICSWQVKGRNDVDFEDWMKLDLEHLDHWSLWLDFKLLVKTIPAVLFGREA